jgi:hypothetical protein
VSGETLGRNLPCAAYWRLKAAMPLKSCLARQTAVKKIRAELTNKVMFSHVVIFWTDPAQPNAIDELIAGANRYLKPIPGVLQFHVGKMAGSHRPVVDQSYQVALNLVFPNKLAQDDYQVHPQHVEFVEKVFKRVCRKVVVYDFE